MGLLQFSVGIAAAALGNANPEHVPLPVVIIMAPKRIGIERICV
jgi:hypothetical protein